MKRVVQITRKSKVRKAKGGEVKGLRDYGVMGLDSKAALIQELIPLGLMHVNDLLQEEVEYWAGEKHKRNGQAGYDRWGKQDGHVYILDQRLPIKVQRVRDVTNNQEVRLQAYERLQGPGAEVEGRLLKRVLHGLSCRRYRECSEAIPEALSLSSSTVSRRYIRASQKKLKEMMERKLEGHEVVAVVMDGKSFGDDGIIMAVGVTMTGKKMVLGIVQAGTENHRVCREFLQGLIERGLRYEQGLLCVIDGAKGMRKALREVFGVHGIVQRCQWHKRENVVEYLPKGLQGSFRRKLQAAYDREEYGKAKAALQAIKAELRLVNLSAVKSLEEGLEETLTMHRIGLHKELRRSFSTTNMIESIHALVEQATSKIDHWKNSSQKQRWVATALLDIEQRLNRVCGYRHLRMLRTALQNELDLQQTNQGKEVVAA